MVNMVVVLGLTVGLDLKSLFNHNGSVILWYYPDERKFKFRSKTFFNFKSFSSGFFHWEQYFWFLLKCIVKEPEHLGIGP